ncbi:MAG: shikimate kinase [Candidatus Pelagibacter sp. TMED286]|nr:MAG: shikimate kinase [Candidatus Pelagibacter sp. TMED286]
MKSKENIVFLGMMGSGKTSLGVLISKKLGLDFFDTDQLIENELRMKISKIFKDKGEIFFRKIEEKITLDILKEKNSIIALGGGAFLNKKIRDEILQNHLSFWLKWDSNTLLRRIKNTPKRPIAFNAKSSDLLDLIKKRSNIYSKALYKINCNDLTKNQIIDKIINIYETKKINN